MFKAGLPIEKFHLVGHSLGGQLSGIVGRNVISKSKKEYILPRYSLFKFRFVLPNNTKHDYNVLEYLHWIQHSRRSTQALVI